jgi:hypothetical protein
MVVFGAPARSRQVDTEMIGQRLRLARAVLLAHFLGYQDTLCRHRVRVFAGYRICQEDAANFLQNWQHPVRPRRAALITIDRNGTALQQERIVSVATDCKKLRGSLSRTQGAIHLTQLVAVVLRFRESPRSHLSCGIIRTFLPRLVAPLSRSNCKS